MSTRSQTIDREAEEMDRHYCIAFLDEATSLAIYLNSILDNIGDRMEALDSVMSPMIDGEATEVFKCFKRDMKLFLEEKKPRVEFLPLLTKWTAGKTSPSVPKMDAPIVKSIKVRETENKKEYDDLNEAKETSPLLEK
jgi:hypothetical protein